MTDRPKPARGEPLLDKIDMDYVLEGWDQTDPELQKKIVLAFATKFMLANEHISALTRENANLRTMLRDSLSCDTNHFWTDADIDARLKELEKEQSDGG